MQHGMEAYGEGGIITGFPPAVLDQIESQVRRELPKEKLKAQLNQERIARVMRQTGPAQIEGIGQLAAKIDARTYFRNMLAHGHEENWLDDLIFDNPQLCAPGYRPDRRKSDFRHGKTFVGGKPV